MTIQERERGKTIHSHESWCKFVRIPVIGFGWRCYSLPYAQESIQCVIRDEDMVLFEWILVNISLGKQDAVLIITREQAAPCFFHASCFLLHVWLLRKEFSSWPWERFTCPLFLWYFVHICSICVTSLCCPTVFPACYVWVFGVGVYSKVDFGVVNK